MQKTSSFKTSQIVLITGASSGLGKELAMEFARLSFDLVLVARNEIKLMTFAQELRNEFGINVSYFSLDLSKSESSDALFEYCDSQNLTIDILVNNAGFGYWGKFIDQSSDNLLEMLNLQILTVSKLTHLFAKQMNQRGSGQIVQISSTSAFQAGPYMASYFASKSYLLLLSEAIQKEGMRFPEISIVCPGAFHSNFEKHSDLEKSIFFRIPGIPDATEIAKHVIRGVLRKKKMIIPGFRNRLIIFLIRFFPRNVVHFVIAKLMAKE